jgi:putative peptide zinc metalloprotease protein
VPPPTTVLDDPVRRLAEGTELLGRYENSGYETPRYLVRRADGQVMQLPELLYLLVESLDGRGAEQIAADLSARLEQDLTAKQVLYLVDERLRPVGLVAPDATEADDPGAATPPVRSDPLLGLRYRAALVPERVAWIIAGLFRPFFLRPVWIAAVGTFVTLDVMVLVQGDLIGRLAAGVTSVIHRPQLSLVLLGLVLLSGAFHECGHVTACRFGGARPGAMGVGLYLVWPAFYSTVTDAYRLNRVGRLRTDLGGVYFNAVFMSAVSLAYLGTGQNWLLVAVFAMHLETANQFLPTLRFDGYYMLADLVGVPDLFAFVGPVFMSMVPGRRAQPRLRELRPWACRLIRLWVALAIPMILYCLVVMLLVLPKVVPVAWRALQQYRDVMQAALGKGDLTTATLGVVELLLLFMPWVGSVLIFALLLRTARRIMMSWGWTWVAPGRWAAARLYADLLAVGLLGATLILRVAQVAMSAPLSPAEARISSSAAGVLYTGRAFASAVGPGEVMVREQLVAYAQLTSAFDRHADVLTEGRELAVVSVAVLVICLLVLAAIHRCRPVVPAVPLLALTVMAPAVTALATLDPGVVGAAWVAVGVIALTLAVRQHGRRYSSRMLVRYVFLAVGGVVAVVMGVVTAPLLAVPLSVGAVVVVVRRGARSRPLPYWMPLTVAAFGVTALTAVVAPTLLHVSSGTVLSVPERHLLVVTMALVVGAAVTVRELRGISVVLGSLALLAILPAPAESTLLALAVCAVAALAALAVNALLRRPPHDRPHLLVRAMFVGPVLLLVMVGGLLAPA